MVARFSVFVVPKGGFRTSFELIMLAGWSIKRLRMYSHRPVYADNFGLKLFYSAINYTNMNIVIPFADDNVILLVCMALSYLCCPHC